MIHVSAVGGKPVRGPDGSVLTLADLPSPDTKRWVIRRKAIVAAAVRGGLITLDMACSRYSLHPEELVSWQYYIDRYGFPALRTKRFRLRQAGPAQRVDSFYPRGPAGSSRQASKHGTNTPMSLFRWEPIKGAAVLFCPAFTFAFEYPCFDHSES